MRTFFKSSGGNVVMCVCNKNGFIFVETHYLKNLFSSTTFAAGPRHLFLGALFTNERFNFSSSSWAEQTYFFFIWEHISLSCCWERSISQIVRLFFMQVFSSYFARIMYLFENHQIPTVIRAHFHFIIPTKGISILHYLFLQ